jgi:hypothetical protein
MAAKRRRSGATLRSNTLLYRLEEQIGNLKQIKVDDERAMSQLREAIDELKQDAKILRKLAIHIFIFIPKR